MSKVVAPLQSFSASGKIGKSLVFFSHLGRNVVRGLVTPKNPKTEAQGIQRLLVGAIGRASKYVNKKGLYYENVKEAIPAGQTWVSALMKNIIETYGSGDTGLTALTNAYSTHSKKTVFDSAAASLNMTPVKIAYAGTIDEISAGNILYILAVNAMSVNASNPETFKGTPYDTPIASWTSANISAFVDDVVDEL